MTETKAKEIVDNYISSLNRLTSNSRPVIGKLTGLAKDNVQYATTIAEAIMSHLQKVRTEIKLPVLYLIDSIVKNVQGPYLNIFSQNVVNIFCDVFGKADANTRVRMWKLRQTWNGIFPATKLYSLDVRVQKFDSAWPISASASRRSSKSPRLNSRHLSTTQISMSQPLTSLVSIPLPKQNNELVTGGEDLLTRQRKLLELQKEKIELELLQAKLNVEELKKQLGNQATIVKPEIVSSTSLDVLIAEPTQAKPVASILPRKVAKEVTEQVISKHVNHRATPPPLEADAAMKKEKGSDLSELSSTGKRPSTELIDSRPPKKARAEKLDTLFRNEHKDLRSLTYPKLNRSLPTSPPMISSHDSIDSQKIKLESKSACEQQKMSVLEKDTVSLDELATDVDNRKMNSSKESPENASNELLDKAAEPKEECMGRSAKESQKSESVEDELSQSLPNETRKKLEGSLPKDKKVTAPSDEEDTDASEPMKIESTEELIDELEVKKMNEEPSKSFKIKEEPLGLTDMDGQMINFNDVPVKVEPVEFKPEPLTPLSVPLIGTTFPTVKSTIDGNVEWESVTPAILRVPSKIKINITKPLVRKVKKELEKQKEESQTDETSHEENQLLLGPISLKPALQDRKLTVTQPLAKGRELSGLCSIM